MLEKCLQKIKLLMNCWLKILYNQYIIFLFSYVNKRPSPFRYISRTKVTSAGVWPAIAKRCGPICCHHQSSTNGRSQWESERSGRVVCCCIAVSKSRRCRPVLCLEERYKLFKSVSSASTKRCDLLTQRNTHTRTQVKPGVPHLWSKNAVNV